ncbi:hypothetical protein BUALT_Bualt10G0032300 [Buddleja alternifolia]|uniref:Myeloid leukemia factor 1 n=1 Tax=Buddleja alternifolia TaxID=168488 RepID=A0AAV6X6L9_9LAMI|nr:hypothetical protein BUALT_Bualt10G0032300 [Buddleja alternifolia]
MQGGRDPFFGSGDPFGNFGGLGGFGDHRSLLSSFFGGRDPFDDPFFRRPFGSMFESSFFGSTGSPFMNPHASGFLEHQLPQPNMSRGPVIEELNSDDEKDEEKKENPRKHGRSSKEPFVEDPDDKATEATEKKSKHMPRRNDINQMQHVSSQPQTHSFTFQSSTVSYGGANGAYYTSSRTRRAGSDGLKFEEYKDANSSTGQASHRVSRGIHDKGHSVSRKLKSDGHVDTMQTLHNLNEDELHGFEEAWKGNARKHIPGWNQEFATQNVIGSGSSTQHRSNRGGWALPSTERSDHLEGLKPDMGGGEGLMQRAAKTKTGPSHGTGSSRFRSNGNVPSNKVNRR